MKPLTIQGALKLIVYAMVGFLLGIMIVSDIRSNPFQVDLNAIYYWVMIGISCLAILLLILAFFKYFTLKKLISAPVDSNIEDDIEVNKYNTYTSMVNYLNVAFTLSIVAIVISATNDYFPEGFVAVGVLLVTAVLSPKFIGMINRMYPERQLPKVGEKNYSHKLFMASDEGERHVMAASLFKSYNFIHVSLIGIMAIILIYSSVTGDSQIFSVIMIGAVLACSQLIYAKGIMQ